MGPKLVSKMVHKPLAPLRSILEHEENFGELKDNALLHSEIFYCFYSNR
jgi:hypothetical protein